MSGTGATSETSVVKKARGRHAFLATKRGGFRRRWAGRHSASVVADVSEGVSKDFKDDVVALRGD